MFNDNGIDFKFVAPSSPSTPPVSAASRGFGAVFLNVQHAGSTTIQYFDNNILLDTQVVPASPTAGQAVFAGELFANPIVTNVLLTLGDGVIFKFDGTTVTPGAANSATNNLVAVDDWFFAEPVPVANGFPIVSGAQGTLNAKVSLTGTVGQQVSGVVATFNDLDPHGNVKDYTATINWGDGHFQNGTIAADANSGFTVSGSNTYTHAGLFPINVDIADFGGGNGLAGSAPTESINNTVQVFQGSTTTSLAVNPGPGLFGFPVTLTATVSPVGSGVTPTGTVTFFDGGSPLGTAGLNGAGQASLVVTTLTPGGHSLAALYSGDANYTGSISAAQPVAISPNVTGLFLIIPGKAHRLKNGHFQLRLTLLYFGSNLLPAPVLLVLDNLPGGVSLVHADGRTLFQPPGGSPFVPLNVQGSGLAPFATVPVDLEFSSHSGNLGFTPRVLAGVFLV
jgi:hypothetical protein